MSPITLPESRGMHFEERDGGVYLWIGAPRIRWEIDPETGVDIAVERPSDGLLTRDQVNAFVIEWLRGAPGQPGPVGPQGLRGEPGQPGTYQPRMDA